MRVSGWVEMGRRCRRERGVGVYKHCAGEGSQAPQAGKRQGSGCSRQTPERVAVMILYRRSGGEGINHMQRGRESEGQGNMPCSLHAPVSVDNESVVQAGAQGVPVDLEQWCCPFELII